MTKETRKETTLDLREVRGKGNSKHEWCTEIEREIGGGWQSYTNRSTGPLEVAV